MRSERTNMSEDLRLDYRDPDWVAQQLGIDKNAVYRYLDEGTLPGLRLGRKWLISESTLADFLKSEEREQTERRRAWLRKGKASPYDKFMKRVGRLPLSERATRVLQLAQQEAVGFGHNYIGQEHLLLGMASVKEGVAAKVLAALGFDARSAVELLIGRGGTPARGQLHLTPRAQSSLELAVKEARQLKDKLFRTEHILLGTMLSGEGLGFSLLEHHGVTLEAVREQVARIREQPHGEAPPLP